MAAMRSEAFPVDGPVNLIVRSPAGVVDVEAADVAEATVEMQWKDDGGRKAAEEATVELRGGSTRPELLVDVQHGLRFGGRRGPKVSIIFGKGPSVKVAIRVPTGRLSRSSPTEPT